jgi:hypothetical protein
MKTVEPVISWIGRILALLCPTTDAWSHEMVPCPFFYHPSKKQFRAFGVFRQKIIVAKSRCLREVEIENGAFLAKGKHKVLPRIRKIRYRNVSDDQANLRRRDLGRSVVFTWHKQFAETVCKIMSILVVQELSELNSRSKKLKSSFVSTSSKR